MKKSRLKLNIFLDLSSDKFASDSREMNLNANMIGRKFQRTCTVRNLLVFRGEM